MADFAPVARPATGFALAAAALALMAGAVAAPLAVYTVTLALFGLPHVLSELRYVDRRFGRRIGRAQVATLAALLALIASARAATVFHVLRPDLGVCLELGLVALLALAVARGPTAQRLAALLAALAIGLATALHPFDTAITFSILHNLTPLGFLWQLSSPGRRLGVMAPAALGLLALPLVVATGLPHRLLQPALLTTFDPLAAGPLARHLYVYVPDVLSDGGARALDLFSASVLAQCGHYVAVIFVLPRMLARIEPNSKGLVPWPRGAWFAGLLVVAMTAGFAGFHADFAQARGVYGILASVHAWLEIPVLILALTNPDQRLRSRPATQDAVLAASETSMAR